jgi:hypothetical protein
MATTPTRSYKLMLLLMTVLFTWSTTTHNAHAAGANYRGPFNGRVVDQDTGQPIEGAVVFVEWHIKHMMVAESFFDAKEVLTDKDGHFFIPKNWSFNPWRNIVMNSQIIIFKAGYGHVQLPGGPLDSTKELAKQVERNTPEQRQAMGPGWHFNIRFDGDMTVFLLKQLSTEKEQYLNRLRLYVEPEVPDAKKRLLMRELKQDEFPGHSNEETAR